MRIPTVKIRNKSTGEVRKINEIDWSTDLGLKKYSGWERLGGETHGDPIKTPKTVQMPSGPTVVDAEEAAARDKGINETEGFREVKRRRGRPRKQQVPNEFEK